MGTPMSPDKQEKPDDELTEAGKFTTLAEKPMQVPKDEIEEAKRREKEKKEREENP